MKKIIQGFFGMFGLELRRKVAAPVVVRSSVPKPPAPDSMLAGMLRAKNSWNVNPATVIDLGAAAGTWTVKALEVWSSADYLLFEPLSERKEELEKLAAAHCKVRPVFAAVGDRTGKVAFRVSDDLDGSAIAEAGSVSSREVDLTTLDDAVKGYNVSGPFVIKFDTHGFELPILVGGNNVLSKTSLVIMECYGFTLRKDSLQFYEMCAHMRTLGFRVADIVESMRRPGDQAYWQCDIFFVPENHRIFSRNTYA